MKRVLKSVLFASLSLCLFACGDESDGATTVIGPDGDNREGAAVATSSLVVKSGGNQIGYLIDMYTDDLKIYDPENRILFWLNDSTGFVSQTEPDALEFCNDHYSYYENEDCSGRSFGQSQNSCDPDLRLAGGRWCSGVVTRRKLIVTGGDEDGYTRADQAFVFRGVEFIVRAEKGTDELDVTTCFPRDRTACVVRLERAPIPTSFPLPITIESQ